MVQGGDPTGTGKGGQSIWGEPFKDEIRSTLKFNQRGVVACANAGPDTNKAQVRGPSIIKAQLDERNDAWSARGDASDDGEADGTVLYQLCQTT